MEKGLRTEFRVYREGMSEVRRRRRGYELSADVLLGHHGGGDSFVLLAERDEDVVLASAARVIERLVERLHLRAKNTP